MWLFLACSGPISPPPAAELPPRVVPPARVVLDAGHGAAGNQGNRNVSCEPEQDVMRRLADSVAPKLATAGLVVTRTRPDAALVDYDTRVRISDTSDYLVSLHSDARAGDTRGVSVSAPCGWTGGAAGFSVLWSDEGEAVLVERRRRFAHAMGLRMAEAGFAPYPGGDYAGLYDPDAVAGVFVDRHLPAQRIRLLRRPRVPSVIVETHEAHDVAEVALWEDPVTHAAFAGAITAAVTDTYPMHRPAEP